MKSIAEQKRQLRQAIKQECRALSPQYYATANARITERVLTLPDWHSARTIGVFASLPYEFDTRELIANALNESKRIVFPRVEPEHRLTFREVHGRHDFSKSRLGIWEPTATCPVVAPETIDLLIVPCLSCDAFGYRLGYGGGYYDRYLATYPTATVLPYFDALRVDTVPHTALDRPVDVIVTETHTFSSH